MLRVRVVSPASVTGPLLKRLTAVPGVRNVVVLREAAHRPEGDAIHFDLSDGGGAGCEPGGTHGRRRKIGA